MTKFTRKNERSRSICWECRDTNLHRASHFHQDEAPGSRTLHYTEILLQQHSTATEIC